MKKNTARGGMLNVSYRLLHNTRHTISPHILSRIAVNHNTYLVHAKISSVGGW
jgi:hypothetical protein